MTKTCVSGGLYCQGVEAEALDPLSNRGISAVIEELNALCNKGSYAAALEHTQHVLRGALSDDPGHVARLHTLMVRCMDRGHLGNRTAILQHAVEAARFARQSGDLELLATALVGLAFRATRAGFNREALAAYHELAQHRPHRAFALCGASYVLHAIGKHRWEWFILRKAWAAARAAAPDQRAWVARRQASLLLDLGHPQRARRALAVADRAGGTPELYPVYHQSMMCLTWGRYYLQTGQDDLAEVALRDACVLATLDEAHGVLAHVETAKARLAMHRGNHPLAQHLALAALDQAFRHGDRAVRQSLSSELREILAGD